MKPIVSQFRVGQIVVAKVKETVANGDIIAAFNGDLLRVKNNTGRGFQVGSSIELEVRSIRPISFRLAQDTSRAGFGRRLRVSV